eukprot:TRINITY_DN43589_c0_g2_i1.p1 TRINITY_DN43589_c0_g2~~TRINITY_DN43589_c0_g2_i1.p1  ORF type:complete len:392 (+),score=41.50 TRINITY_DN43589_c0_g2_i1:216-1391(+)
MLGLFLVLWPGRKTLKKVGVDKAETAKVETGTVEMDEVDTNTVVTDKIEIDRAQADEVDTDTVVTDKIKMRRFEKIICSRVWPEGVVLAGITKEMVRVGSVFSVLAPKDHCRRSFHLLSKAAAFFEHVVVAEFLKFLKASVMPNVVVATLAGLRGHPQCNEVVVGYVYGLSVTTKTWMSWSLACYVGLVMLAWGIFRTNVVQGQYGQHRFKARWITIVPLTVGFVLDCLGLVSLLAHCYILVRDWGLAFALDWSFAFEFDISLSPAIDILQFALVLVALMEIALAIVNVQLEVTQRRKMRECAHDSISPETVGNRASAKDDIDAAECKDEAQEPCRGNAVVNMGGTIDAAEEDSANAPAPSWPNCPLTTSATLPEDGEPPVHPPPCVKPTL